MTTLYLIRHAQAAGNLERRFQGHTDSPLSAKGQQQLEFLSRRFEPVLLDRVYTSPLIRALHTAKAVTKYHALEPVVVPDLIEINGGDFENQLFTELPTLFPNEFKIWMTTPHLFPGIGGGESMTHFYQRVIACINGLVSQNQEAVIALASHGCVILAYLSYLAGGLEEYVKLEPPSNTGVFKIVYSQQPARPELIYIDNVSHLPEELRTSFKDGKQK